MNESRKDFYRVLNPSADEEYRCNPYFKRDLGLLSLPAPGRRAKALLAVAGGSIACVLVAFILVRGIFMLAEFLHSFIYG